MKIQSQTILYFVLIFVGISGFFFTLFLDKPIGFYAFVITAALGGLGVSTNICITKRSGKDLVCPTGSDCNAVVNSRYSKFLGIPLEYLGILYFLVIVASYLALIVNPQLTQNAKVIISVALLTISAALFSCYLLSVQAFLLRKWCIWCILASMLSLTIFFVSLISLPQWTGFLGRFENMIEMLQFLGYAFGLGSVTSAIFLFFNDFIKDRKIDDTEFDTLKGFSELIWLGYGMVIMSQLAFFVINPGLGESGLFVVRIIALLASGFAGAVIMVILSPFITYIPFAKTPEKETWLSGLRKPVFITGAIAVYSWYFSFFTHFLPEYGLTGLISTYTIILVVVITVSMLWEQSISKPRSPNVN